MKNGRPSMRYPWMLLLGKGIIIFEHLTPLDQLPQAGFLFTAFPLKIKGGSGSPIRATGLIFE